MQRVRLDHVLAWCAHILAAYATHHVGIVWSRATRALNCVSKLTRRLFLLRHFVSGPYGTEPSALTVRPLAFKAFKAAKAVSDQARMTKPEDDVSDLFDDVSVWVDFFWGTAWANPTLAVPQ